MNSNTTATAQEQPIVPEINPALKKLITVIPVFQKLFPFDSMPAVSDTEKFVAYFPGKQMIMADPTGNPIKKGDGLFEAINEKTIISSIIPKEIFGFPFRNISIPIYDEQDKETLAGALGFAYSLETQSTLQEMAQTLSSSTEELNAVAEEFAATASGLADKMATLAFSASSMFENLKKTDDILLFIDDLADRTKLLGLNALIEAARAGEYGRSFGVVAQEIQKMSDNSANSVKTIKELLKKLQQEVTIVTNLMKETREISSQQSIGSIEISKSLESISKITENLSEISFKL
jgi:hypothetical protein